MLVVQFLRFVITCKYKTTRFCCFMSDTAPTKTWGKNHSPHLVKLFSDLMVMVIYFPSNTHIRGDRNITSDSATRAASSSAAKRHHSARPHELAGVCSFTCPRVGRWSRSVDHCTLIIITLKLCKVPLVLTYEYNSCVEWITNTWFPPSRWVVYIVAVTTNAWCGNFLHSFHLAHFSSGPQRI